MDLSNIFFLLSCISLIWYFFIVIILHIKNHKKYNPLHHPVGKYAKGANKKYFQFANWCNLAKNLFLALGFYFREVAFPFKQLAVCLLVFSLFGYVILLFSPRKSDHFLTKIANVLTHILPVFQFWILSFFVLEFTLTHSRLPSWIMDTLSFMDWLIRFWILGVVIGMFFSRFKRYFWLFERVYLYVTNLYYLIVCIVLLIV